MNRRDFLANSFIACAGLVGTNLLLSACAPSHTGGDSMGTPSAKGGNCLSIGTSVAVEVLHTPNHSLSISPADIATGVAKTYTLTDGGSAHTHQVIVSESDFLKLRDNQGIQIFSVGGSHSHLVTVNCA